MSDNEEQREHQATARRLDELREKGQTLRSKDLSGGLILGAAIIGLIFMSDSYMNQFRHNFTEAFSSMNLVVDNHEKLVIILRKLAINNLLLLIPLFLVLFTVSFASVFIVGGWNFSFSSLTFNLEKLNPITNLSNIFGKRIFTDIGKSSLKFIIIMLSFYYFITANQTEILSLPYLQYQAALSLFFVLIQRFIIIIFMGLVIIMTMDVLSSYFNYQSKTKMTTQELKDENKETEGNADVKRKIRSLQYALAKQKIPQMVPKATVVITNPTHYAVALRYHDTEDKAPKVLAKGKGSVAAYIRRLAVQSGVPIYEEPPLARALFHTTRIGATINPALYLAVAIVLTYINQIRRYQSGQGPMPEKTTNLSIPNEFLFKD